MSDRSVGSVMGSPPSRRFRGVAGLRPQSHGAGPSGSAGAGSGGAGSGAARSAGAAPSSTSREKGMKNLVFAVSLGLLLHAAPASAAFVSAELRVNGLSCPFCAFGIEKKLLDVDGVRGIEIFLDDGRIALVFEPENQATVADLEKAVEKAGFEIAALRLTLRGQLLEAEEAGALLVSSARLRFRLVERRGESTRPISTTTLRRLRDSTAQADDSMLVTGSGSVLVTGSGSVLITGSVLVTGSVLDRDEAEPTLVVEFVEAPER